MLVQRDPVSRIWGYEKRNESIPVVIFIHIICGGLDQDKETKRRVRQEEQCRGTYAAFDGR